MQPLAVLFREAPAQIALIYVLALLVLGTVLWRVRSYRIWELALLAGLAFLANVAFRSAMDWLLVMLALGVPHLRDMFVQAARTRPRPLPIFWLLRLDRTVKQLFANPWFRFQAFWPVAAGVVLLIISVVPPLSRNMPVQNAADWPVAALNYMEAEGITGRFFAPPDYGSYIGWRLRDRAKIYTDSRGFFFPPILIEDCHYLPQLLPEWRPRLHRVLDEFHTDYFLLETTGGRGALWQVLKDHVDTPLFLDEQTVLLSAAQVRRGVEEMDRQVAFETRR